MIYLIGEATETAPFFRQGTWNDFQNWVLDRRVLDFDIETTVTPYWCNKEVLTVQFGDTITQWVIQWPSLSSSRKKVVQQILESERWQKVIHNAAFECVTMLFHGIRIRNVFDTMLAEKVLFGGDMEYVQYSLEALCDRRLGVRLDKSFQTSFSDEPLTPGQVLYAAQDVTYLSLLRKEIYQQLQAHGLDWTIALENEAVLAFSEMIYHGMEVDQQWWYKLADEAEPLVGSAEEKLNAYLHTDDFKGMATMLGYISDQDRIQINWNSPKQKQVIFQGLFPHLPGTSKAVLKKYVSTQLKQGVAVEEWLPYYIDGDCSEVQSELLKYHRDFLIDNQLLIPAGQASINWNSTAQVLPLIQCVEVVKDLSEESLGRCAHPIIADYQDFKDTYKLISSYGTAWLEKNLEPDGKVRTSFNQVLTTGRISSSKPNMQQIPAKEAVGNKYRNAFVPPDGWSFVSSDYVSQELIVIAYLSGDPVWQEALSKGQDLHSIAAEMVFKDAWKIAAEENCAYYQKVVDAKGQYSLARQKCKCSSHKYMRNGVKTINFGLAYGMSEFKLAATLRISVPEAKQLILDYFKAFPGIGRLLEYLGRFGVTNGYIQTIWPFFRKRYFPMWKYYLRFIDGHLMGAQYHPGLGEIERASKNMPIQGSSADMMKLALCFIYWEIHDHAHLEGKVKIAMTVHDQADTYAHNDFKEQWAVRQTELMEAAAKVLIPTGILKAETTITDRWSK